ncbi:50S ribosomal protein L19 [Roseovarius sp. 217]|nr:50S ribosomal protein L19 [Roseovarius sp. 217]
MDLREGLQLWLFATTQGSDMQMRRLWFW